MDFSSRRLNDFKIQYYDSEVDSDIQLIFVPGLSSPEAWKHQIRYFGKKYRTITYKNKSFSYDKEKEVLEAILNQDEIRNSVIITANLGNSLANEFEENESVIATSSIGLKDEYKTLPDTFYRTLKMIYYKPKIVKKIFFGSRTNYRVVKKFIEDVRAPTVQKFNSFRENYSFERPVKNAISVHGENDRFDSMDFAREMEPNMKVCTIKNAGSFCFYEKPEEFNKVLSDFINQLEGFVESREVGKAREKNRSLKDFAKGFDAKSSEIGQKNQKDQRRAVAKKK